MSALVTAERPTAAVERPQPKGRQQLFDDGLTLEDRILGAWEDLVVEGCAACPVCGGSMAAEVAAGGAVCEGCGATLD